MADPRAAVREYLQGAFGDGVTDSMDPGAGGALFRVVVGVAGLRTDPASQSARE